MSNLNVMSFCSLSPLSIRAPSSSTLSMTIVGPTAVVLQTSFINKKNVIQRRYKLIDF